MFQRRVFLPLSVTKTLHRFRSKFEETVYKNAKKSRKAVAYEASKLPYIYSLNYIPDFELPNGILVETKGYFPPRDRVKMVAVKKSNPDRDIRILFMNAKTKLRKGSSMTYGDWADKYGFIYADGDRIPLEWFK